MSVEKICPHCGGKTTAVAVGLRLSAGRVICLEAMKYGYGSGRQISRFAKTRGENRSSAGSAEWADKHLRWLREAGLAKHTGQVSDGAKLHALTDKGRAALREHEQESKA